MPVNLYFYGEVLIIHEMKHACISFFLLFLMHFGFGQELLQFEKTIHDFGLVNEDQGLISYSFSFINAGDQPVKITGVNASCGCTTPAWTKEEILPGDSGFITAQYNPLNRPGHFKKSLRVSYSLAAQTKQEVIYIEGNVKPKPKSIEEELPTQLGALRLKYRSLNIGKITTEKVIERTFEVYNDSDSVWDWMPDQSVLPHHITVNFEPVTLKPKETGRISVRFDPNKKDELGFISDHIMLFTSENMMPEKELNVIATVEEYFPPLTADELEKAPKLTFDRNSYDFGNIKKGATATTTFTLTNYGQQDLLIRQIKPNCGCTVTKLKKDKIAPGKSVEMEVSFDSSGRRGRQYKTVTVFSNDPTAPTQTISLKAEISD